MGLFCLGLESSDWSQQSFELNQHGYLDGNSNVIFIISKFQGPGTQKCEVLTYCGLYLVYY